jgi:hypothetical protein
MKMVGRARQALLSTDPRCGKEVVLYSLGPAAGFCWFKAVYHGLLVLISAYWCTHIMMYMYVISAAVGGGSGACMFHV